MHQVSFILTIRTTEGVSAIEFSSFDAAYEASRFTPSMMEGFISFTIHPIPKGGMMIGAPASPDASTLDLNPS